MPKRSSSLPKFNSEAEERAFWEDPKNDSTAYVDWAEAKPVVLPGLKPSTTSISIRLPDSLLADLKVEANRRDVPYQSLMKVWLAEKVSEAKRSVRKPR